MAPSKKIVEAKLRIDLPWRAGNLRKNPSQGRGNPKPDQLMRKCTYCGKEYPDDVAVCPYDGQSLEAKPPPLPPSVKIQAQAASGPDPLGTTSMVLGIISLVCGPFLGIPAVICGHISLTRSRGQNGKAVAGLVTGYLGTFLVGFAFMAGLLLPALSRAKQKAELIRCFNNMKQIGRAARMWADNNNNTLPQNLLQLSNELANPNTLICPMDTRHHLQPPGSLPIWDPNNITYELVTPGLSLSNVDSKVVIVRCPIHGTELWKDGSVHAVRQPYHKTE
ncbi:MAG TPA: DUF4190 domain-containing protein [Verrucomicrobiae bacterium]|nr:DUF4190 domain-containing protein [Verrucomicrobiae bacterium]